MGWSNGAVEEEKNTGGEVNSLPGEKCAGLSPIIHLRFSDELAGHGTAQSAVEAFHDSDAGHDMWSRTISRNEDSGTLPCVRLQRCPMRSATKIAARRAGRIVLALPWPAGRALVRAAGHLCSTPDRGNRATQDAKLELARF